VGETNNGKTMIASRFQRLHPAADNARGDHASSRYCSFKPHPLPMKADSMARS
jgi:hypothetical protein